MTDYSTWKVGDKVVCVDDDPNGYRKPGYKYIDRGLGGLRKGDVYTVRSIGIHSDGETLCVKLHEVDDRSKGDFGFAARRFRRVVPRKTDISVFTAMLNKTGVDS